MKTHTISLIPGDGIGPEVSLATTRCIEATGVKVNWEVVEAGSEIMEKAGTPLPENVLDSIRKNKIILASDTVTFCWPSTFKA